MKWWILMALAAMSGQSYAQVLNQQQLQQFGAETEIKFGTVQNYGETGPKAKITLNNASKVALPRGETDWKIYFHSVRKLTDLEQAGVKVKHIQGDLHEISPTANFKGLAKGETLSVEVKPSSAMIAYTDFMPRAFIVGKNLEPVVFANTDTEDLSKIAIPLTTKEQLLRGADDIFGVATAASRYEANTEVNDLQKGSDDLDKIIPTPSKVTYKKSRVQLNGDWIISHAGGLAGEANYLNTHLTSIVGKALVQKADHLPVDGRVIEITVASGKAKEALPVKESYTLDISDKKITIVGADAAGAFYGVQSLLSLIPANAKGEVSLPQLQVQDTPRAEWRGMHYDMGRNFHGKDVTFRLIEQMARYKLNKLHFHVTEDEGWRLEIPGLPELTEIGANRCFDLSETKCLLTQLGTGPHSSGSGNGFYSTQDFIDILKYAAERHIEVIPEIDMPGHARAAVKSMEARYKKLKAAGDLEGAERYLLSDPKDTSTYLSVQNYTDNSINVCLASTYRFVDKVVYELQQMYRKAGVKLNIFHMGGDETGVGSWAGSPACQALYGQVEGISGVADLKPYFVSRVSDITYKRGLQLAGWEDGLMYDAVNPFVRREFKNEKLYVNAWDNIWEFKVADRTNILANSDYNVILSHATHLYFDHPYENHPDERGYYWAARFIDVKKVFGYMPDNLYANADKTRFGQNIDNYEAMIGKPLEQLEKPQNIMGIQGQVWSETIRTAEQLEQHIYPRLIPLAERAWHKAAWEGDKPDTAARDKEYASFAHLLAVRELPKMAAAGVSFHLPPPGAKREKGLLVANTSYPGLAIEYSTDNGASWKQWNSPVEVSAGEVLLRTRLGDKTSRITDM